MRGRPELARWGAESLAGAEAVFVGSEHIRAVLEDVVGHVDRVHEVPPGVDVDEFVPEERDAALAALIAEARRDPADGDERHPDPGNAERFAAFFADDGADDRLRRQADREQGRAGAVRRAARSRRARGHRRLRRLPRRARGAARPDACSSPARSSTATSCTCCRSPTSRVVPSIFPEAFGMVAAEAASAGVPPLVADHSGLAEVAAGIAAEYPRGAQRS